MTRVGERPRQREVTPSLRAILRRPSRVEVNVLRRVSSTAQSAVAEEDERDVFKAGEISEPAEEALARQKREVLLTQNTSRQQAVTPRLGGRFVKFEKFIGSGEGLRGSLGGGD